MPARRAGILFRGGHGAQPGKMRLTSAPKSLSVQGVSVSKPTTITARERQIVLEETARCCNVPIPLLMGVHIKEHPAINARSLAIAVLLAMGDRVVHVADTFNIQQQAVRYAKLKVMADPIRIRVRNSIHKKAMSRIDGGGQPDDRPPFEVHWGTTGLLDADREEILGFVCRYLGIQPRDLQIRKTAGRAAPLDAHLRYRCITAGVLIACHDTRNSVARVINRNHTAIRHALRVLHEREDLQRERDAVLDSLPERFRVMHGRPAPQPAPLPNLGRLSAEYSAMVRAYVDAEVLSLSGARRMGNNTQIRLLMLLGEQPDALDAIVAEVAGAGHKGHAEQLRRRASTFARPAIRRIG